MTVECADISFYFKDQAVDEIVWRGKPVYSIYPMDKIPDSQPLTLPGFVWEGKRRPSKEQVFNRIFRPSERNEYDKLPRPEFPITQKSTWRGSSWSKRMSGSTVTIRSVPRRWSSSVLSVINRRAGVLRVFLPVSGRGAILVSA